MIREDPTLNIEAADELERRFPGVELILIESGGDNLASTFSRDLTDFWMFVIDVSRRRRHSAQARARAWFGATCSSSTRQTSRRMSASTSI